MAWHRVVVDDQRVFGRRAGLMANCHRIVARFTGQCHARGGDKSDGYNNSHRHS
jgi:hypothetical protein